MFTPEEIEARAFVMVRRGYDTEEVAAFLRAVGDDVRRLQEELAESRRRVDPLDSAMADAVAIVQSARESAARIEAQAETRHAERLRELEDEVARRFDRARNEARTIIDEARDQAATILSEANARRALAEADIAAARSTWLRESTELDILSRRRRSILDEAQDSLEQWMSALRDIVAEARETAVAAEAPVYPEEPEQGEARAEGHVEVELPHQEEHALEPVAEGASYEGSSYDGGSYEGNPYEGA